MGLGGYITIYNDTGFDLVKGRSGAYQMRFESPGTIPAGQSRTFYVEWGQGGSVADDDSAYSDYVIQDGTGRILTIEAWARPGKHFQMRFKSYSQPGYPVGTVSNIGWSHNGTVSFRVEQEATPQPDPCFLEGSLLLTRHGYRPVESLRVGQEIVTLGDHGHVLRAITFIGHKRSVVDRTDGLEPDEAGWPVCVKAHALADNVPRRDLWVTAEHCLLMHDQLVPVRMLINGSTIAWDKRQPEFDYYHVATETHSILVAENLYAESYLPGANACAFTTSEGALLAALCAGPPARPVVTERSVVEPLHQAIVRRAGLGTAGEAGAGHKMCSGKQLTRDPDLHLTLPCGRMIAPQEIREGVAVFSLTSGVERVFIRSRSDRPCDTIGSFVDDRRRLGVLVGSVTVQDAQSDSTLAVDFTDSALRGWHEPETTHGRWTSGSAEIVLPESLRGHDTRLALRVIHNEAYRV